MFIPHSEKKVFNLRINLFIIFITPFLIFIIVVSISYFTFHYLKNINEYKKANQLVQINEKRSHEYEEMINNILENHTIFKSKLNVLQGQINTGSLQPTLEDNQGGPLNRIDIAQLSDFELERIEVNKLINDYQYSIQAFGEVNKMVTSYNKLLNNLPIGNPVKGPFTIITSPFGPRINPISKVFEFHNGLDMANQSGTPIVVTAPGIVEKVDWDPFGYGWYCKISHKLLGEFSTLYGHMRSQPVVSPGEKVKKGQIIGYMGRTGSATGTHLHYEVRIDDSLVDPWPFVSVY